MSANSTLGCEYTHSRSLIPVSKRRLISAGIKQRYSLVAWSDFALVRINLVILLSCLTHEIARYPSRDSFKTARRVSWRNGIPESIPTFQRRDRSFGAHNLGRRIDRWRIGRCVLRRPDPPKSHTLATETLERFLC